MALVKKPLVIPTGAAITAVGIGGTLKRFYCEFYPRVGREDIEQTRAV